MVQASHDTVDRIPRLLAAQQRTFLVPREGSPNPSTGSNTVTDLSLPENTDRWILHTPLPHEPLPTEGVQSIAPPWDPLPSYLKAKQVVLNEVVLAQVISIHIHKDILVYRPEKVPGAFNPASEFDR